MPLRCGEDSLAAGTPQARDPKLLQSPYCPGIWPIFIWSGTVRVQELVAVACTWLCLMGTRRACKGWVTAGAHRDGWWSRVGDEVASGTTVEVATAATNILKKVRETMSASDVPIKAIVSECTELPGYTNMLRAELHVPVFDAITAAGMLYNAIKPRDKYHV